MEGPTDNSNVVVPGEANAGSPLGHLASDKPGGLDNDFADMPLLRMSRITNQGKGYPLILSIFQNKECYLLLCKARA